MVWYGLDIGTGGRGHSDIGSFLHHGRISHPNVQVGDVGADTRNKWILWGSHHRVVWRILGKTTRWRMEGMWYYPPYGGCMGVDGLKDIKTYISRRQNMVAQYITTCPILYI